MDRKTACGRGPSKRGVKSSLSSCEGRVRRRGATLGFSSRREGERRCSVVK
jgi:hypothetical protein